MTTSSDDGESSPSSEGLPPAEEIQAHLAELVSHQPDLPLHWEVTAGQAPAGHPWVRIAAVRRGLLGESTVVGAFRIDEREAVFDVTAERSPEGALVHDALARVAAEHFPAATVPGQPGNRYSVRWCGPDPDDAPAGEYVVKCVGTGTETAQIRCRPLTPGRSWGFQVVRPDSTSSSWFELSLDRVVDERLGEPDSTFWAVYNGIDDDSRVLAHATILESGSIVWHTHPALMPDTASDAGEMLLALVEALAQLQLTTGPWPAWAPPPR